MGSSQFVPIVKSEQDSASAGGASAGGGSQLPKRKRVTRACDECRKKKVKCDGQQPCIHCTVYSYDCTYDQPSNRKKSGADVHQFEAKLRAAQQVLQLLVPDVDVFGPGFSYRAFEEAYRGVQKGASGPVDLAAVAREFSAHSGLPSGLPSASDGPSDGPSEPSDEPSSKRVRLALQHPNVDGSIESRDGREIKIILPPKNIALELVTKSWASPCVLFRFYHRPSFIRDLDDLYETDPENYTNKQNKFLPLAYSVMAVGALFSKKTGVDDTFLDDEGYRYFVAARKLIDITDARDMYAIQTIMMLILFLQCSARLSTCYSYIGVALRSALREGLHRKLDHPNFNPIELEIRKRIFWTIYKMDIYVNTMLGLPRSISLDDIDQDLPRELDDENITDDAYLPQEDGKLSSSGIANCHTRLMLILNSIVKHLYPINSNSSLISHEKVSEMELELRAWLSNLPKELIPGFDPPFQYYKANRLLHLAFLHVQIVLYRPFIHYISPRYTSLPNTDSLSIQRAKNCISVARTVVNLAQDMIKKNLISGSYWFSIYTIFFSVACLVYYVHEVPFDEFHPDYIGIRSDAEAGREILTLLKDSSMAASRTYNILNSLFEQLNRKTAYIHTERHRQRQREQEQLRTQNSVKVPVAQNLVSTNDGDFTPSANPSTAATNTATTTANVDSNFGIKLEDKINDFDHLANFDNFINQPEDMSPQVQQQQPPQPQTGQDMPQLAQDQQNVPSNDDTYLPGIMDKLDMQIFGRFLPPYMLKRPEGATGPGAKGGDLPNGLQSTIISEDLKLDDLAGLGNWDLDEDDFSKFV